MVDDGEYRKTKTEGASEGRRVSGKKKRKRGKIKRNKYGQ